MWLDINYVQLCVCVELHVSTYIMAFTSKNTIVKLNKGEKLNGNNYSIWSMEMQYVLDKQDAFKAINIELNELEARNMAQHRRD